MRSKLKYVVLLLVMALMLCGFKDASSEVDDGAGIFTNSEINDLNKKIQSLEKEIECQIVVVTVMDDTAASNEELAIQYDQDNKIGYKNTCDCVIMLLNMDPSDRGVFVYRNGKAEDVISDTDGLIDEFYDYLVDGDYYAAADEFVNQVESCYDDYNMSFFERACQNILFALIGALVLSAIIVFFMVRSNKAKMTVNNHTYLKNNDYNIHDRRDMYINTTVVQRKINNDNNSGGGGGGSHGGGSGSGRSF